MPASSGTAIPDPRILYLLQRFPPAFGGGFWFLSRVRDRIQQEGFQSIVVTGNRGIRGGSQPGVYRLPSPGGEALPRLDAYSFALMAGPVLLALRRQYDFIHTIGNAHYAYLGILAGRILRKPVIVSSVQNRSDDPGGILQERFGTLKNAVFSRASAYICCSGLQVDEYRRAGYPMKAVHFIPNGCDTARFRPCESPEEKDLLRERLGLPKNEFTLVTVGAICERKGIDLLVEAWIRFRGSTRRGRLVLVGPDSPDDAGAGVQAAFVKSVCDRLVAAGEEGSVQFTGRVANVEEYLRSADAFALMSRGEGFPLSLLEAMNSQLPFVIWNLPDYDGYDLRDGEHGFLLPCFDVERLARCLVDLADSPAGARTLGIQARALASRYTLDASLARHVALYREIASVHRSLLGSSAS
jgi:glycosyltransferase involved in cell wall biosynthesis